MTDAKISFRDVESLESFTNVVSEFDYNIYVRPEGGSKETKLNAKSILGLMSLSFSKTLELIAQTEDASDLIDKLKPYIVKNQ